MKERCVGVPDAPAGTWRNLANAYIVVQSGPPFHRGNDLIATADAPTQTLTGKIAYSIIDKDLRGEDVELFGCLGGGWQLLGSARTDDDGRFALVLEADDRLPIGLRDLYVSVVGDRTGASFLAYVAPAQTPIVVSDLDGTLTASENAYPESLAGGGVVVAQDGAAAALAGHDIIYITARGDRFTQDTRNWLAANGFPRGPLRMPPPIVTQPGADTIEFKMDALGALADFSLEAGIGNRASDIAAYANAGLSPDRIFIKLPEFADEIASELAAGHATGFTSYDELRVRL